MKKFKCRVCQSNGKIVINLGKQPLANAIKVNNSTDYSTNVPGIYAIGDVNTYQGKLKLILCGFHEGTVMVQSAFKRIYPDWKAIIIFETPNYKVQVGNFKNYYISLGKLNEIKKKYPSAFLLRLKI